MDNSQLLAQMRNMAETAGIQSGVPQGNAGVKSVSNNFGNMLERAINNVNSAQQESAMLAKQVEAGDGGASLVQAMIASQKADISFQALLQVRNKVASAYK
ncbi:MAG: flagellar hook-basal body complex protein FliE, partial [Gammaproteobacteria bacterium]|nr:flagellar hook-basal body complex protein FliE [Gammaproteobacteria bacterium]